MNQITKLSTSLGILVAILFITNLVQGFTEPTQAPPGGNVSPLLSTGPANQTKSGDLTIHRTDATGSIGRIITDQLFTRGGVDINSDNAPIGLIVEKGNVGIGTVSPIGTLDVRVNNQQLLLLNSANGHHSFLNAPGNAHLSGNAYWDGVNWRPFDTTRGASVIVADGNGNINFLTAPPGSDPLALAVRVSIDSGGDTYSRRKC